MYAYFSENFLRNPILENSTAKPMHTMEYKLGQTRMLQEVGVPAHGGMINCPKAKRVVISDGAIGTIIKSQKAFGILRPR